MPQIIIQGGTPLHGTTTASGSKNSVLPLLAASILLDGETEITNVPFLMDVSIMIRMLNSLGLHAEFRHPNKVVIQNKQSIRIMAPYDLVTSLRASFFVAGPILARNGIAKVPLPGGCSIGSRPVDIHLKGFEKLGASVTMEHGFIELKATELTGAQINLEFPSVGATENLMMAASLAKGTTYIYNAACEPEIVDLAEFLTKAGAKISGAGTPTIIIDGVPSLNGVKNYPVIPDRIEAGTLLIAGAITKGCVTVKNINASHLNPLFEYLRLMGFGLTVNDTSATINGESGFRPLKIETKPFPGFPTDMQAQMMSLLTIANGQSIIKESIFENRFMHARELMRMGASIELNNDIAIINGVSNLSGADVRITDLRAGAALILAGLVATGHTTVYGLKHLKRGYDNLPGKLKALGAQIAE